MKNTIKINGKETELSFMYDDSSYAYHKNWKDLVDCWGSAYGSRSYADHYMRRTAYGVIVAGRIGHHIPIVSADHCGVLTNAEKKALMERAVAFGDFNTIENV